MTPRLFGCVCGQFHSGGAGLGMEADRVSVPIPFYVVEHPDGVALFDCGLPEAIGNADDPYRLRLNKGGMDSTFEPQEMAGRQLERLDIDPARVRFVVLSHLHFDHAGGLHQIPNATLVVQKREWEAGFDADISRTYALPKRFFDLGHEVRLIEGEYDLFGDGSAVCIPSYGHTPGHQSLRVKSAAGDHLLIGDACYNRRTFENRQFPGPALQDVMNRSMDRLAALSSPETVMVFGHDPDQWGASPVLPSDRG